MYFMEIYVLFLMKLYVKVDRGFHSEIVIQESLLKYKALSVDIFPTKYLHYPTFKGNSHKMVKKK